MSEHALDKLTRILKAGGGEIGPQLNAKIEVELATLRDARCSHCAGIGPTKRCVCGAFFCEECSLDKDICTKCQFKAGTLSCSAPVCNDCALQCGICTKMLCRTCVAREEGLSCATCNECICVQCNDDSHCFECGMSVCDDCQKRTNGKRMCYDCNVNAAENHQVQKKASEQKKRKQPATPTPRQRDTEFDPRDDWYNY